MSELKNPAARLLRVFKRLGSNQSRSVTASGLSGLLNNEPALTNPFELIIEVRREFADLGHAVGAIDKERQESVVLAEQLPKIQQCIDSMSVAVSQTPFGGGLGGGGSNGATAAQQVTLTWQLNDSAMTALAFMAMQMPADSDVARDELEEVRGQIEALRAAVSEISALPDDIQRWLLELIRLMRDAIDVYYIRGAKGAREQLARVAGEIALSQKYWAVVEESSSDVVSKVKDVLARINSFAMSCRNFEYLSDGGIVRKLLGADPE